MTYANQLDANIAAIVNGGFVDPLGDSDVVRMARQLDAEVTIQCELGTDEFELFFSDGSHTVCDVCGD